MGLIAHRICGQKYSLLESLEQLLELTTLIFFLMVASQSFSTAIKIARWHHLKSMWWAFCCHIHHDHIHVLLWTGNANIKPFGYSCKLPHKQRLTHRGYWQQSGYFAVKKLITDRNSQTKGPSSCNFMLVGSLLVWECRQHHNPVSAWLTHPNKNLKSSILTMQFVFLRGKKKKKWNLLIGGPHMGLGVFLCCYHLFMLLSIQK